jgi:hypothetical protein
VGGSAAPSGRPPLTLAPEVLEPIRCQLGVAHGVLNVLVPEVRLQRPRVVPGIGQGTRAARLRCADTSKPKATSRPARSPISRRIRRTTRRSIPRSISSAASPRIRRIRRTPRRRSRTRVALSPTIAGGPPKSAQIGPIRRIRLSLRAPDRATGASFRFSVSEGHFWCLVFGRCGCSVKNSNERSRPPLSGNVG